MRNYRYIALCCLLSLGACKTTSRRGDSELLTWESEDEKVQARGRFIQAIEQCVPLISGLVTRGKAVNIKGDAARERVVATVVDKLIAEADPKAQRAALLLQLYYADKWKVLPPCGGQATEFVLTEFATRTNVIELAFGQAQELKAL